MKKILNVLLVIFYFLVAVLAGIQVNSYFVSEPQITPICAENDPIDTMPLENGNEAVLDVKNGYKQVTLTYQDLIFVTEKRRRLKKFVKNVDILFKRAK